MFYQKKMNKTEDDEHTNISVWNAPFPSTSSSKEGFDMDSTFPVLYMKQKIENMRENRRWREEKKPNIFEQTNYKNIELFETIQETFKKSSKKPSKKIKKKKSNTKNTLTNIRNINKSNNPVSITKQVFKGCCDEIAALLQYAKTVNQLSGEINDTTSEKYITTRNSKWLQERVGETFVVIMTLVMSFSIMFYSTKTFECKYNNPLNILNDIQAKSAWIQPFNIILELFLQDVTAPFTILLKTGFDFVPKLCNNAGLSQYPHFLFVILFGILFGFIWEIYQNIDWFLTMFFDSFKWKINPIMFALVMAHIFVRIVIKMIKPDNMFDEIFYRPTSLGGLAVLGLWILIRLLIALFLVPIAQMFFGFGFLLFFFFFPVCISFFKNSESIININKTLGGGAFDTLTKSFADKMPQNIPNIPKNLSNLSNIPIITSNLSDGIKMIPTKISETSTAMNTKTDDYWLKSSKLSCHINNTEYLLDSVFPILFSIPLLLKFSQIDITQNAEIKYDDDEMRFLSNVFTNWKIKYQENDPDLSWFEYVKLFLLRNIISIIFIIFFITHTVTAANHISTSQVFPANFYIIYTILNSIMIVYFLYFMSKSLQHHLFSN